jgi:hypothetical protein
MCVKEYRSNCAGRAQRGRFYRKILNVKKMHILKIQRFDMDFVIEINEKLTKYGHRGVC